MAASLVVTKVESKTDFKTLLEFPWTLYKDDPYWVPPLMSMQRHKLDREHNSSWQHMEGDYFIARRNGEPVGTIAAFVNHRHNEFHGENIGFFGLFEVRDDQEAANALLNTAAAAVRARGVDAVRGPTTFSTNEESGILIEGFDDHPVVLMPYNYPYYQRLLENAPGFDSVMDFFSFRFTLQGVQESERLQRFYQIVHKNNERRQIVVREPDTRQLKREFKALRDIYNSAWDKNWGFVPFSDQELDELVADLGMYFDPKVTLFAEVRGKPVAFLLALPDMNQPLHHAYPRPGIPDLLSQLQVLWHWKLRTKITRIRILLMGVEEGYRGIGVEAAMFAEMLERAIRLAPERGWTNADGGWVLETNEPMIRLCDTHGGAIYKRYRMYERALTGDQ